MVHPPFSEIVDLLEDRLSIDEQIRLQNHLDQGCVSCRETARWIARVRESMLSDTTPDPPDWLVTRCVALFNRWHSLESPPAAGRLVASLVFDTARCATPDHVRRDRPPQTRCLLFRAGEFDIDLQFCLEESTHPSSTGRQILGQVLRRGTAEPPAHARVDLLDRNEIIDSSLTDEFGEFRIADPFPSAFDLRIAPRDAEEILILGIDARPSGANESD